jgi:hypothetical protein
MMPTLVDRLQSKFGDGQVWDIGGGHRLLVLPEGEMAYICAYDTKDRVEQEWLTQEIERIAKSLGSWVETAPSIDIWMIVVRSTDTTALLQACANSLNRPPIEEP